MNADTLDKYICFFNVVDDELPVAKSRLKFGHISLVLWEI